MMCNCENVDKKEVDNMPGINKNKGRSLLQQMLLLLSCQTQNNRSHTSKAKRNVMGATKK